MFTQANTERVEREKNAAITVIIGNPPYNVGQKSENDNNKNRKYKVWTGGSGTHTRRIRRRRNKNSLSDMYVKFFRWATDRLEGRDGIVCFVSNNSFVDQLAFDGMRKHFAAGLSAYRPYRPARQRAAEPEALRDDAQCVRDSGGRRNHARVKKRGAAPRLRYYRVPEMWRKERETGILGQGQCLVADADAGCEHTWLVPEHADEYRLALCTRRAFRSESRGLETNS